MADSRAGSWLHPSGGARAGNFVYSSIGNALVASAAAVAAAAATLTNFQSVTLVAPLYTGPGSILDSRYWIGVPPQAGHVVYFDPANGFSVASNGEVSAAVSAGSWVVQYFDGSAFSTGLVEIVATALMGSASGHSGASAALTTALRLAGAAAMQAMSNASLTTGIKLTGAALGVATAISALITQIRLDGLASGSGSATGALNGGPQLFTAAQAIAAAQGSLTTGIPLTGGAQSLAVAAGAISTAINLAGALESSSSSSGLLTSQTAQLTGAALSVANSIASLTASIDLDADAVSKSLAAAALSTEILMRSIADASANASGGITALGPVVIAPRGTSSFSQSRRPRVLH